MYAFLGLVLYLLNFSLAAGTTAPTICSAQDITENPKADVEGTTGDQLQKGSITLKLNFLQNRTVYCIGETAQIECLVEGSTDVSVQWFITEMNETVVFLPMYEQLAGHNASNTQSNVSVLTIYKSKQYKAMYQCFLPKTTPVKSDMKELEFRGRYFSVVTYSFTFIYKHNTTDFEQEIVLATCLNATSISFTVATRKVSGCQPVAELEVRVAGRACKLAHAANGYWEHTCSNLTLGTPYEVQVKAKLVSSVDVSETRFASNTTTCSTGENVYYTPWPCISLCII